ncbi:hypothetical protein [Pedobacter sp. Hv1]|uniref:hypothetical protein n=1 Tax=Pedobacter sp. Hv1 TaxID=1740090 RepID=UPI0006D898F5|nr:hypothetical protein [Pedobacter sp. Hv1]KQC02117.1 hypothetical protein AQF98_00650 [Pedobacter sp. Hv1]
MEHAYKFQLIENLKPIYGNRGWSISISRLDLDEIIFTLPIGEDVKFIADNLYSVLDGLPEIDHPKERVRFVFILDGDEYHNCQIRLINPNSEDHKFIAMGPERFVTLDEYKNYQSKK